MERTAEALDRSIAGPLEVFEAEWCRLRRRHGDVIDHVPNERVADELRRGVETVFANLRWAAIVGDVVDTPTACSLLGVSRQALHRRLSNRTLIGLAGETSTQWPVWQFEQIAAGGGRVRPVVASVVGAFADALGDDYGVHIVASWATAPNVDLGGEAPADWIAAGRDDATVIDAAHAAAFAEAQ